MNLSVSLISKLKLLMPIKVVKTLVPNSTTVLWKLDLAHLIAIVKVKDIVITEFVLVMLTIWLLVILKSLTVTSIMLSNKVTSNLLISTVGDSLMDKPTQLPNVETTK
jgi:hypothetical protein